MTFVIISLLLFNSCNKVNIGINNVGAIFESDENRANARMNQILTAIKSKDSDILKSLFSKKALTEAINFDSDINFLFNFIQGDIVSWELNGWPSDESIEYGKSSLMIRFGVIINTDKDNYDLFVVDYNVDTINPDNEGIYMIEISKVGNCNSHLSWQERLYAGIHSPKE